MFGRPILLHHLCSAVQLLASRTIFATMNTNGVANGWPARQRAAQYDPKDNAVHVQEIPVPSIEPDELLVKVSSASLCHSDLMLFEPNEQGLILGEKAITMGHEAVGRVLEVGGEAEGFKPGDTVCLLCLALAYEPRPLTNPNFHR